MISIITPVYNGERFIREAVSSVEAQTCENWEWIIVNDGSTDGTAEILECLDDPRIQVVHQQNLGVSAARNVGLDLAKGKYITFLDADDLLPANALSARADFLDAFPDVDIVNAGVHVTSDGKLLRRYKPDLKKGPLLERLARLEPGVFFGVLYMIRREKLGDHRFSRDLSHSEDLVFFLTLAHDAGLNYGAIRDTVYEYRLQENSAMSDVDGLESGYLGLIRLSVNMPRISDSCLTTQRQRVQRILFRSWLRIFRPDRALLALYKIRRACVNQG
ncbi:glycosyltransferase family 2 protein [Marinobacter sp. M-5]|uniref:glycosyltransferase family 2 protein n=1 Tax=Marinobacter sp. M-5 TaxID=3081089 RepID=UPI00293CA847|nr:glycosyltransferase family 2 protein [Marinobacter sp. M-5]MDV3503093.1 glycosyltransferase family 2 protein [Marinobacter sp. M-5]